MEFNLDEFEIYYNGLYEHCKKLKNFIRENKDNLKSLSENKRSGWIIDYDFSIEDIEFTETALKIEVGDYDGSFGTITIPNYFFTPEREIKLKEQLERENTLERNDRIKELKMQEQLINEKSEKIQNELNELMK